MDVIRNYITATPGIGGEIKRRISDFVVEEVGLDGRVSEVRAFTGTEKFELEKNWDSLEKQEVERGDDADQLIVTLEKFNMDLNFAVTKVARWMGVSRKRIGYAGIKDKRAITAQRVSIWKADVEKLRNYKSRYIDLRDGYWANDRINIGDLKGNRFRVVVRNIELGDEEIKDRVGKVIEEIKEKGIANYFGEQRFGGARGMTHLVGREFVRGNVEDAVMLYLTATYPREEQDVKEARVNLSKSRDFSAAVREFPKKYRYERAMIHHLCRHPKDFAGAFRRLPKSMCYLFTHAYQSWLFNRIIDERIEQGIGIEAVEGDLPDDKGFATGPLFGFEGEIASGKVGEIEKKVLEEEGLELGDFKIKEMPELSSKGTRRKIKVIPEKLRLISVEEDEFNEGKVCAAIEFELSKGSYATVVLREFMKSD